MVMAGVLVALDKVVLHIFVRMVKEDSGEIRSESRQTQRKQIDVDDNFITICLFSFPNSANNSFSKISIFLIKNHDQINLVPLKTNHFFMLMPS